jgi:molybdate transport system permease protein
VILPSESSPPPAAGRTHRVGGGLLRLSAVLAGVVFLSFLALPVVALFVRVAPAELLRRMLTPIVLQALGLSLLTSVASTLTVVAFGLPLAHLLAVRDFPGKRLLAVLIDLPMVLPPTVAGVGLLLAFGRTGVLGGSLAAVGLSIPFTTLAVVLAQVFVAAPFFVNAARSGFEAVEPRYLRAAATLRATPLYTFRRVLVPLSAPALLAGAAMTWARALGEFGATITFAGNLPGRTQTLPLAVYVALQSDLEAAVSMSVLLVLVACGLLIALRGIRLQGR